jgi:hypothetical protein
MIIRLGEELVKVIYYNRNQKQQNVKGKVSSFLYFKYYLLAIRLEDTSVYNLICCLVVVS